MMIVRTSVSNLPDAKKLANAAVKKRLAACASFWKVNSAYFWKGELFEEGEYMLEMKASSAADAKALIMFLEKIHPYEVPMIYSIATKGCSKKYAKWIAGK